jgi:hypothetical protein
MINTENSLQAFTKLNICACVLHLMIVSFSALRFKKAMHCMPMCTECCDVYAFYLLYEDWYYCYCCVCVCSSIYRHLRLHVHVLTKGKRACGV